MARAPPLPQEAVAGLFTTVVLFGYSAMSQTVTVHRKPERPVQQPAETSPFLIEFFVVQGVGFHCVAYCDSEGQWRDAFNNEELFGDIQILA